MLQHLPALPASELQRVEEDTVSDGVREYLGKSRAAATQRAYRSGWNHFAAWLERRGVDSLPPIPAREIAEYIAELAGERKSVSTITQRLAAISLAHRITRGATDNTRDPLVTETMAGIRRVKGRPPRQAQEAMSADIRAMVMGLPNTLRGVRDKALLLIGLAGAFRRSELVSLDVEHIAVVPDGLQITLWRSKTDQIGQGALIGIPRGEKQETCPQRAYEEWLRQSHIAAGPVFRPVTRHGLVVDARLDAQSIARVVKLAAEAAGLNPKRYSGHSLRSGFATQASKNGASLQAIAEQTRHRSLDTLRRYIRKGNLLGKDNAARRLGL